MTILNVCSTVQLSKMNKINCQIATVCQYYCKCEERSCVLNYLRQNAGDNFLQYYANLLNEIRRRDLKLLVLRQFCAY